MTTQNLQLIYTLLCDDVRLEMGNKISLMGVFQNILVEKTADFVDKIRCCQPLARRRTASNRSSHCFARQNKYGRYFTPTNIELAQGGFSDNVSFFVNVVFPTAGTYWVQTLANMVLLEEFPLIVTDTGNITGMQPMEEISETIN